MAYRCIQTCYSDRLYEEGNSYSGIGPSDEKFFEQVDDDGKVIESGADERAEVKAALDKLGVSYNKRLGLEKLQKLLTDAQSFSS